MARPRSAKPARRSAGGTVVGIFIGLVLGVLAALAVVWYMNKTPVPFVAKVTPPTPATTPGAEPLPLPGKPGDPPMEKRFQFYDILPGKAEPVPSGTAAPAPGAAPATGAPASAAAPAAAPTAATGAPAAAKAAADTWLQAGSFQSAKDADNLKAMLALNGLEAGVQQVMVADKVWYRVRLGPYREDEARRVKGDLAKSSIQANVVRGE